MELALVSKIVLFQDRLLKNTQIATRWTLVLVAEITKLRTESEDSYLKESHDTTCVDEFCGIFCVAESRL